MAKKKPFIAWCLRQREQKVFRRNSAISYHCKQRVVKLNWEVNRLPSSRPAGPNNYLVSNPSFPINLSTVLFI